MVRYFAIISLIMLDEVAFSESNSQQRVDNMASNNTEVDYAGGKHGKPPRSRCQRIGRAIYNPQKKEFLGRTCSSWAKIGVFYFVFYACLAGFFAIMLVGFFSTLSDTEPTMTGMYSLIKNNPGMGYRPLEDIETTLIKFNSSEVDTYKYKVYDILKYLRENGYIDKDNKTVNATAENQFDLNEIHPDCNINYANILRSFGYADGKPCVLLKINRVYGWVPEAYSNESDIAEVKKETGSDTTLPTNSVAVTCEGENDGDIDILGKVKFFPEQGFATKFFPYKNAEGYRGPLVFAQFTPVKPGVLVQIWCKIWAKNVKHHRNDKGGSVRFELLVDTEK